MRLQAVLFTSLASLAITACGSTEQPQIVEQIIVREPGAPPVQGPGGAEGETDLVALGEDAFQRCAGCHSLEAGGPSAAGPNLHGVIGRAAGSHAGFPFTDAMVASDIVWDEQNLDRFLADPSGTIPGSEMTVGTVADAQSRKAIIAFLASKSD